VQKFFAKLKSSRLEAGSQKAMISDSKSFLVCKKTIYFYVASGSPTGCCYMTQPGTYEHQGALPSGKARIAFG